MATFSWLFKAPTVSNLAVERIFPLDLKSDDFLYADIVHTYQKILIDVMERTSGLNEKFHSALWDSCVQTEAREGLITLLSQAMAKMNDLYLVYKSGVLRKADPTEEATIRADYEKQARSPVGVFISFKKYRRTEMLRIYSMFEYCVLGSLNKTLNLSRAIQVKVKDLRQSVALADANIALSQGREIAGALKAGNDVMTDVEDEIVTAAPDTSTSEKAIDFIDAKRAFILSLPLAYIKGEQTGGMNTTGESDMRAIERGLKQYFESIMKPTIDALWNVKVEFNSQDFRQMTTALEVMKTFDLTSDENLSKESKQTITAQVFGLEPEEEKKKIDAEAKIREAEAAAEQAAQIAAAQAVKPAQPGQQQPPQTQQTTQTVRA